MMYYTVCMWVCHIRAQHGRFFSAGFESPTHLQQVDLVVVGDFQGPIFQLSGPPDLKGTIWWFQKEKYLPWWYCTFFRGLLVISVLSHDYYLGGSDGVPVVNFPFFVMIVPFLLREVKNIYFC